MIVTREFALVQMNGELSEPGRHGRLDDLAYQDGLMGLMGGVQEWYYSAFLDWLSDELGHEIVLGMAPTFTGRVPLGIPDNPLALNNQQPVPEPATILLFGTGIAGLLGARLRRKKD